MIFGIRQKPATNVQKNVLIAPQVLAKGRGRQPTPPLDDIHFETDLKHQRLPARPAGAISTRPKSTPTADAANFKGRARDFHMFRSKPGVVIQVGVILDPHPST